MQVKLQEQYQKSVPSDKTAEKSKLQIAVFHNLPHSGARRAVQDYMNILCRDGHHIDLFDYKNSNDNCASFDEYAGSVYHAGFNTDIECKKRLPLLSGYIRAYRKYKSLKELESIGRDTAERIDSGNYDVAFIHHCEITQAPFVLKYLKTPSVFYSGEPHRGLYDVPIKRNYIRKKSSLAKHLRSVWYLPASAIENRLCLRTLKKAYEQNIYFADILMVNSYFSQENFSRIHGLRGHVIHPGVDTNQFKPINTGKKNIVLSVGGIEPIKGHDLIIESLSKLPSEIRPCLYIVAGRGNIVEKRYLADMAKNLCVCLSFKESISDQELVELYNQAKLTLCGAVMEPFGLTPIESLACGTPVIAVNEGGFRESVKDGYVGLLCRRDSNEFAKCISELITDNNTYKKYSIAARDYIMSYWTLDRVRDELIQLFQLAKKSGKKKC